MNKRIKWGIIILIGAGLAGLGIYQFTPHENEELTAADALPKENKQRTLKVNAQVIKPHLLTDEILVTGLADSGKVPRLHNSHQCISSPVPPHHHTGCWQPYL